MQVIAPQYSIREGSSIEAISLHHFVGPCRVLDMTEAVHEITTDALALEAIHVGERILLKTQERGHAVNMPLSYGAAEYLAQKELLLLGIDGNFGMPKQGTSDIAACAPLCSKDIPTVIGLDLSSLEPGVYSLVVVPLLLQGAVYAPARAILLL